MTTKMKGGEVRLEPTYGTYKPASPVHNNESSEPLLPYSETHPDEAKTETISPELRARMQEHFRVYGPPIAAGTLIGAGVAVGSIVIPAATISTTAVIAAGVLGALGAKTLLLAKEDNQQQALLQQRELLLFTTAALIQRSANNDRKQELYIEQLLKCTEAIPTLFNTLQDQQKQISLLAHLIQDLGTNLIQTQELRASIIDEVRQACDGIRRHVSTEPLVWQVNLLGDIIDARESTGFLNRPERVTQLFEPQMIVYTAGGDYAEGNIDKQMGGIDVTCLRTLLDDLAQTVKGVSNDDLMKTTFENLVVPLQTELGRAST